MTTERKAHGNGVTVVNWPGFDSSDQTRKKDRANAAYIAAASPSVVIALLDERDRLRVGIAEAIKWAEADDGTKTKRAVLALRDARPGQGEQAP